MLGGAGEGTEDSNCSVPTKCHTSAMWPGHDKMGKLKLSNSNCLRPAIHTKYMTRGRAVISRPMPPIKKKVFIYIGHLLGGRVCAVAYVWRSEDNEPLVLSYCASQLGFVRAGVRHLYPLSISG